MAGHLGAGQLFGLGKCNYYALKTDEDIPQSKALIPGHEEILKTVCQFYSIDEDDLYKSKRGVTNEPRNVSIYLIRQLRMETLRDIGRRFKIEKYSSVSSIIERVKAQMKVDSDLAKRIEMLTHGVTKSQRQIFPVLWLPPII